jgi:hypothetical protein
MLCDQAESYWSKASTCSVRSEISNSDIGQLRHSDVIHDVLADYSVNEMPKNSW